MEKEKMKTETKKWTRLLESIIVASLVALVPMGSAQAGIEGQKSLFMILRYITPGLSLLLFVFAFVYTSHLRRLSFFKPLKPQYE